MRNFVLGALAVMLLAAAIGVGWIVRDNSNGGDETAALSTDTAVADTRETATVKRQDLVETEELDGTLGFGDAEPLITNSAGVVTWVPEDGAIVDIGETLFHVDNEPVILLRGTMPVYRPIGLVRTVTTSTAGGGETTETEEVDVLEGGLDILQLEQNLSDLGFTDGWDVTIDETFSYASEQSVKAFQDAKGLEDTGVIEVGRIVFADGPVRVASVTTQLGQTASKNQPVLNVTGTTRRVFLDLDTGDTDLISEGDTIKVELPDGTVVDGDVTSVSDVATVAQATGQGGAASPTLDVTITLADTGDSRFDQAPVTIIVTTLVAEDVLTVPIASLVALSEGGHAVEKIVDGEPQLTGVRLGDFVDNTVEIEGDLVEADQVVVAG